MIEQLRPPRTTTGNSTLDLAELRKYIATTITALNVILLDIDRRLNNLEKGEKPK